MKNFRISYYLGLFPSWHSVLLACHLFTRSLSIYPPRITSPHDVSYQAKGRPSLGMTSPLHLLLPLLPYPDFPSHPISPDLRYSCLKNCDLAWSLISEIVNLDYPQWGTVPPSDRIRDRTSAASHQCHLHIPKNIFQLIYSLYKIVH